MLKESTNIHVYIEPVDMRKAINGLSIILSEQLYQNPQSGEVFIFRNKTSDKVKVLVWDKNGFILHYKRLEKGRFKFPKSTDVKDYSITPEQMGWLLAGLDFILMGEFSDLNFDKYY